MKHDLLYVIILATCLNIGCQRLEKLDTESVVIDYFGQIAPDIEPVIFAPELISLQETQEYGGHYSPDGKAFYFTCFHPGAHAIIMVSSYKNGTWTTPDTLSFMKKYPGAESCFSPDGSRFFYVWADQVGEKFMHDIYVVDAGDSIWSEPHPLTDTDLGERRISPSVSANFNIYYSGNVGKPDDKDIFVSQYGDPGYNLPQNLGEHINSDYYEEHVFIAPNESYILFDSYRPGGFGGSDIYISFRKSDASWSKAINLGTPINTEHFDWYPKITPDGKYLIFSRTIDGKIDMYWCSAKLIEKLRNDNLKDKRN